MHQEIEKALSILWRIRSQEPAVCRIVGHSDECNLVGSKAAVLQLACSLLSSLVVYGKKTSVQAGDHWTWESDEAQKEYLVWYELKDFFDEFGDVWPVAMLVADNERASETLAREEEL
jgi:hypothetical protein